MWLIVMFALFYGCLMGAAVASMTGLTYQIPYFALPAVVFLVAFLALLIRDIRDPL